MRTIKIKGEPRTALGKSSASALRRANKVPCELYGGDENIHFSVETPDLKSLVYTPDFHLAEVEVDGTSHRCIIKDIQFHPVSDRILHVDFLRLQPGKQVKVELPLKFTGTSPGEKVGGKLTTKLHRIKVQTTPESLVDVISLDISDLELGQSLRIRDIELDDDVQILHNPGIPIASIEIPRALKSADAEAAEEEEQEEEEEAAPAEAAAE